jgi:hypothetical protein
MDRTQDLAFASLTLFLFSFYAIYHIDCRLRIVERRHIRQMQRFNGCYYCVGKQFVPNVTVEGEQAVDVTVEGEQTNVSAVEGEQTNVSAVEGEQTDVSDVEEEQAVGHTTTMLVEEEQAVGHTAVDVSVEETDVNNSYYLV